MKNFRKFCASMILALSLILPAFAGDMSTPGATAPPRQQSSVTGDMPCPGASATGEIQTPGMVALDPVTEVALGLLQGLMSLF